MGGQPSTIRRHEHQQPAVCTVDVPAQQEETPPEAREERCQRALHRAVEAGDEAEVRRLLAENASVNAADNLGRTPLVVAAGAGSAGLSEMLANAGADVGVRDRFGRTALHAAAEAKDEGSAATLVKLLLRRGTSPQVQDGCGRSALHCALQARNLTAAAVLVPAAGTMLQQDDTGRTPLHWAAAKGTPEMVRQLITCVSGASEVRDKMGMTPLARALQAFNRETAGTLVVEACPRQSIGGTDVHGRTELHLAAYAGYPEVVRHLLDRGFWPWAVDLCGRDALIWAVESGEMQVVEEIMREEGYCECIDNQGKTALHVAAIMGDAAIVALLLHRGANAECQDTKGRTPLMYALRGNHRDAVKLLWPSCPVSLQRRDCHECTLLHWAAVGGDVDAVRDLLACGVPVNAVDAQGKTAIALAVEHGHEKAAAVLLGADGLRLTWDCDGRSPLHGAAARGWSQVALQLVALGADPHEGDKDLVSPVMLAMRAAHFSLARDMVRAACPSELLHPDSS